MGAAPYCSSFSDSDVVNQINFSFFQIESIQATSQGWTQSNNMSIMSYNGGTVLAMAGNEYVIEIFEILNFWSDGPFHSRALSLGSGG